jgi:hypothetical protein
MAKIDHKLLRISTSVKMLASGSAKSRRVSIDVVAPLAGALAGANPPPHQFHLTTPSILFEVVLGNIDYLIKTIAPNST